MHVFYQWQSTCTCTCMYVHVPELTYCLATMLSFLTWLSTLAGMAWHGRHGLWLVVNTGRQLWVARPGQARPDQAMPGTWSQPHARLEVIVIHTPYIHVRMVAVQTSGVSMQNCVCTAIMRMSRHTKIFFFFILDSAVLVYRWWCILSDSTRLEEVTDLCVCLWLC